MIGGLKVKDMEENEVTQEEINEMNKMIPFVDTKIYWKDSYGWTSLYWEKLSKLGWSMVEPKDEPGTVHAIDDKGTAILSADDRITLLRLLVNFMVGGG
ncbi:MAG: hypothetical protein ACQESO_06475 [Bacillota bacterium]